jgi:lipoprotein-anchoring transpeptidase ErfK/SrfK
MRDHEAYELERSYAIEQVPWVQYFSQGYGLHAAFWHERFGEPHSRGCINLSPRDARFLFAFTSPALPPGWFAIRPAPSDPSTLVVVR